MKRKKLKTLPALKKACWALLSEWIRRKDADEGGAVSCYCCGAIMHWKESHAGHFVGGRTGSVLLNPEVIRVCCPRCNLFLGGNYTAFTLRMIDEVGREKVDELLALRHQLKKWSREDLEAFKTEYKAKLEAL